MATIFSFLLLYGLLTPGIEAHFKKPVGKSQHHTIKNIDFIYMINLDERPEKFASCVKQLTPYGIFPYRFSAVNGWKLPYKALQELGVQFQPGMNRNLWGTSFDPETGQAHDEPMHIPGKSYFYKGMTRGAIGICLSHLSVLQDAYDSGYKTIWVMEDDIEVIRNPHRLSRLIEKLDRRLGIDGWDILFTDQDTKLRDGRRVICISFAERPYFLPLNPARFAERKIISPSFRKIGARYGAYSMIVRRSGMEKILKFAKQHKIFLPYDMEYYLPEDIRMYTTLHDVVSTQLSPPTDNCKPGYEQNLR